MLRPLLIPAFAWLLPGCLLLEEPCDVPDATENNLLGNGVFDALTCWYDDDDHDWENMGLRLDQSSPGSGSPVLGVSSDGEGYESRTLIQGPWFSNLRTTPLGLQTGDQYQIRFYVRADDPTVINVSVQAPTVPWSDTDIVVDTEWTEITTFGTAGGGEFEDAWVEFQLGRDATEIYLDDIELSITGTMP